MPATSFPEYAQDLINVLNQVTASGEVILKDFEVDQRSSALGLISGILDLADGSSLHFREFVNTNLADLKMMYSYHYQDVNNNLIFRYDNAAHKPALPQAEHKHLPSRIELRQAPTLVEVIDEILSD